LRSIAACSAVGLTALLAACSDPAACSVTFYGGCDPAPVVPAATAPAAIPVVATPARPAPVATGPAGVGLGDPSGFADVDDKQCRSYGLAFGTRDYADCRIKLSAQHRGLDPNTGAPVR
jgi:hypothetical protein